MTMTPSDSGLAGVSATVTNIVQKTGQDATGAWVTGREVNYQLSNGHMGSVFIPMAVFSPEAVQQAVMADATKLAQAASLVIPLS